MWDVYILLPSKNSDLSLYSEHALSFLKKEIAISVILSRCSKHDVFFFRFSRYGGLRRPQRLARRSR